MAGDSLSAVICVCFLVALQVTSGANIGHFWHVTDFHYDHTYWSEQLSCNDDVPQPGVFGDYWCDSPWRLVTDAIEAMTHIRSDVDFLVWTGDTVAHIHDDHLSVNINMDIMQNLTTAITKAFPNKTVYATFGGYYTRLTASGLRIVALNTNLYYTSDRQTPGHPDPAGQFQWFRTTMERANSTGEKVIVIAHIPPGLHTPRGTLWFQTEFVQPFNSILTQFAHNIVGMHFGHDHHDGFKIFYDAQVTPWRYKLPGQVGVPHNPAIRLVTFDRDTGRHLDIQQYYLDLPASNKQDQAGAETTANFTLLFTTAAAEQEGTAKVCNKTCKARILCGFKHYTMADFDACVSQQCDDTCPNSGAIVGK
ncbi:hypothetical protein BaRGS_00014697 [Batillaria attramentaria]|uniref:Uncharacterized protein n=1 Tax=Batillaria attramentaria TaxID=370345 RepID=A0ABD0L3C2_9CAEN